MTTTPIARSNASVSDGKDLRMSRVAVVGAGTMGNGIAHVFAQFGWNVTLIDISEAALEDFAPERGGHRHP